jgi:hypothetical protein
MVEGIYRTDRGGEVVERGEVGVVEAYGVEVEATRFGEHLQASWGWAQELRGRRVELVQVAEDGDGFEAGIGDALGIHDEQAGVRQAAQMLKAGVGDAYFEDA